MDRIKNVVRQTFFMAFAMNLFLIPIFWIDSLSDGGFDDWHWWLYTNLYAIIVCLVFGYMDKPKLENRILLVLLIISLIVYLYPYPSKLSDQAGFIFWGLVLGRKLLVAVDYSLASLKKVFKKNKKNEED